MPKKGKKLDESQVQQHMAAYSDAVAGDLLNRAFGRWEASHDRTNVPYLDRADHVIIGGRVAAEVLMEKFNEEFPNLRTESGTPYRDTERAGAYGKFYKTMGKQYLNQMISGALANGERVEVFVPDRDTGKIKDEPMRLTARGYEPTGPLVKPRQLNGWQRFWSKIGFYKKEKAAVVNYEKEMDARKRVQFSNKVARANLATNGAMSFTYLEEVDRFHPEVRRDMADSFPDAHGDPASMGERNGFRTTRSCFYATVMQVMATKRDADGKLLYTNEQMFDMGNPDMQRARADAFKETYERYKAGDTDWLVDVQHEAATVLRDRMDSQAAKLDFSRADVTEQTGYREFAMLSDTAFDQSQDMASSKERMDEKYGKGAYWDAGELIGNCTRPYRRISESLTAQKQLLNGIPTKGESAICGKVAAVIYGESIRQEIGRQMKENPGRRFTDIVNPDFIMSTDRVHADAGYDDDAMDAHEERGKPLPKLMEQSLTLSREHISAPEQFGKQIVGGVFERRIQLQELSGDETKPSRFEIRTPAEVEREMTRQTAGAPAL